MHGIRKQTESNNSRGGRTTALLWCTVLAACIGMLSTPTLVSAREPALIAIIIDDLGNQLVAGRRTVAVDAPLTCSVMPHTAYGAKLAREAHAAGKEVMLHLPMQPMQMNRIAGPGEISLENSIRQLQHILDTDLNAVPHVVGINNHMGSLITRHPGHMRWLMDALAARGNLFFVDSVTTPASVAYATALEAGVPAARRHVFLDDDPAENRVAEQFERLKLRARMQGYAIGIGHPYPVTLDYLERVLPELRADGEFRVVPVSRIVAMLGRGELQREEALSASSLVAASDGDQ